MGREEGRAVGREEGRAVGREEGRAVGREEAVREIQQLIRKGKTLEKISNHLNMPSAHLATAPSHCNDEESVK